MILEANESIRILDEHHVTMWDEFVLRHSLGTIYHTSAWMRVLQKTFRHEPFYLYLEKHDKIHACLPLFRINSRITGRHLSCLPATTICDPLAGEADLRKLMEYAQGREEHSEWIPWEIRTGENFHAGMPFPSIQVRGYVTHRLDLQRPLEMIWRSFHQGQVVRSIRKASRSNLTVVKGSDRQDVSEFYRLYLAMRKSNGLLPQPLSFFLNLWDELSPPGRMELALARIDSRPVSGVLLLKYRDAVIYEFGATDPAALKARPSQLLLWQSIEEAHNDGYRWFDFGRTRLDNVGLLGFKDRWGTRRIPLVYYQNPDGTSAQNVRENRTMSMAMDILMRNLPGRLCQWLGNILYRHFV